MHKPLFGITFLGGLRHAIGEFFDRAAQKGPRIRDLQSLQEFVETRANHVTQTSLYGYLRTRAGSRYPELFANDAFLAAINAAKWNVWTACVSDLAVYAGGLIAGADNHNATVTSRAMIIMVDGILGRTGIPAEADSEFPGLATALRCRLQSCKWCDVPDNETVFTESSDALVRWAPIMEELKQLDAEIVRNSVRFRWNEVRQDYRRLLDAQAVLASAASLVQAPVNDP